MNFTVSKNCPRHTEIFLFWRFRTPQSTIIALKLLGKRHGLSQTMNFSQFCKALSAFLQVFKQYSMSQYFLECCNSQEVVTMMVLFSFLQFCQILALRRVFRQFALNFSQIEHHRSTGVTCSNSFKDRLLCIICFARERRVLFCILSCFALAKTDLSERFPLLDSSLESTVVC